ncbi:protein kinase domain-containing protein [Nocardia sp. NBC_01009]|uniref:serine/threonine-protein kinase n=1 Tax=Nocardia sp. NBC_01009 TaxID=2975996 RepID=UPI003870445C|nr:protein kinase [Nocardia sp. NBC_01009]
MLGEGELFAGYRIERLLGQGGMGSVYLARHPRLPRSMALKLLNPELFSDNEIRARFEREADLVAQLDHPNIVTVFDRGVEDEQLWISMQYVDGIDASTIDRSKLPPTRAAQIVAETAKALDFAHGSGVLHRDVKPANILLARATGGQERVFLTDFGIARLRDDAGHLTLTGTFTATLAYAAPEQLTGAPMDGRADQYALACTLHWLLTGAAPFEAPSPPAVIQGHLQVPPPRVTARRADLPAALDEVLIRALGKRPTDRYGSCTEFADAVYRALHMSAPHAMPVTGQPGPAATAAPTPMHPPAQQPAQLNPQSYPSPQSSQGSQPYPSVQPYPSQQGSPGAQPHLNPQPYQGSQPYPSVQPYASPQASRGSQPYPSVQPYPSPQSSQGSQPYPSMQSPQASPPHPQPYQGSQPHPSPQLPLNPHNPGPQPQAAPGYPATTGQPAGFSASPPPYGHQTPPGSGSGGTVLVVFGIVALIVVIIVVALLV